MHKILLTVALLAMLSGCGGDDEESKSAGQSPAPAGDSPPPPTAPAPIPQPGAATLEWTMPTTRPTAQRSPI